MSLCCPPRLGCNSSHRDEPCVLEMCRTVAGRAPVAARAVARWQAWQDALAEGCSGAESRFQRRAYERARGEAMGVLVMEFARGRRRPARRRAGAPDRKPFGRKGPRSRA